MDLFGLYNSHDEQLWKNLEKIPGLKYYPDFITTQEETLLIHQIDQEHWLSDLKRKVQHYGYKYDYRARKIDESFFIGRLPQWSQFLLDRLEAQNIANFNPDQIIVNNYEPGEGIAFHVDCEPCFSNTIMSLSLFSDIVMDFRSEVSFQTTPILLKRRSLITISDDSRYKFQHGIAPRKSDIFNGEKMRRSRRISLTFRKVIL